VARLALEDLISYDTTRMALGECLGKIKMLDSLSSALAFERKVGRDLVSALDERIRQYNIMTDRLESAIAYHSRQEQKYKRQRGWYSVLTGVGVLTGTVFIMRTAK
jgi:hypothetical protein